MNTFTANFGLQKKAAMLMVMATIFLSNYLNAETGRYRAMFGNNTATEMTIGFDAHQLSTNPILYYSTNPIDVNNLKNYSNQTPDKVIEYRGMINCFVRLTNLLPGQTYYFAVKDNSSTSEVYRFETIPNDNNTRLSIIAGGDSRSDSSGNSPARPVANKIVAKLNAQAFIFDGDFTRDGTEDQWKSWFDDWQLTINSDNRITPIIPARGNHERNNVMLVNLFDCAENIYYSNTFGNDLLQVYTLNSEIPVNGASEQTKWLETELANSNSIWQFAQYHKPMRPHVKRKREGSMQYGFWSGLFYRFGVDAVLEGDSHTAKTTWPIIPCSGGFDCKEGFKRDDEIGTIYFGEGAYAAPLRFPDDTKMWTRDSGMFYQFKLIYLDKNKLEIRTVKYDVDTNTDSINELSTTDRFSIPNNLEIWNPTNGDVVTKHKQTAHPTCTLTMPKNNKLIFDLNEIELSAEVSGTSPITGVQFYVDGNLEHTDNTAPYQYNWKPSSTDVYTISAIATDENGLSSNIDFSTIKIGDRNNIEHTSFINIGSDECIEYDNKKISATTSVAGYVSINEFQIRIGEPGVSLQGLRFNSINIPPNAVIESAHIIFKHPRGSNTPASATFWCEDSANSLPFVPVPFNITRRKKTSNFVEWHNIALWNASTALAESTTPDLADLIQSLIQHPDWTVESPITFLINGTGERNAASFMATQSTVLDSSFAPQLTVRFSIPECIGKPCDDDDPDTNTVLDENCNCVVVGCTDINACNYDSKAMVDDNSCIYPVITCDDGDPDTIDDILDEDCDCKGFCNENKACNYTERGKCTYKKMLCSDGDRYTVNDRIDENCNCVGQIIGCTDETACNYNPDAVIPYNTLCQRLKINNLKLSSTDGTSVSIDWDDKPYASYELHYKLSQDFSFKTVEVEGSPISLSLDDCKTYEFAIEMICASGDASIVSQVLEHITPCNRTDESIPIEHLKIYPQPAENYITIEFADGNKADYINISDLKGRLMIDQNDMKFNGTSYQSNIKHLPSGTYLVTATKDNQIISKKIIVK